MIFEERISITIFDGIFAILFFSRCEKVIGLSISGNGVINQCFPIGSFDKIYLWLYEVKP